VRPIRLFGDPVLRTPAVPVVDFDRELRRLVQDLTDTMLDAPGSGLAAPQLGVSLRVFTYHVDDEVGHLVNPTLELSEQTQDGDEGCLSIPGLVFPCTRAQQVVACGVDQYGEPARIEGSDLLARCMQHETDHLDGVLFVDRLDAQTRRAAMGAIRSASWAGEPGPVVKQSPHPMFRQGDVMARLLFAGTPAVALPALDALVASRHQVVGVLTRPDSPTGRGRRTAASPVACRADELGLPVLRAPSLRDPGVRAAIAELGADCAPVVAYGALLPPELLDLPRLGWVNLHFSLLPAWRGAAPVQHSLLAGDDTCGATTFTIVEELDAGPVLGRLTEMIHRHDTTGSLLDRLSRSGADLLVATVDGLDDGVLVPSPQPSDGISYAPRLSVDDARVRWSDPGLAIDRRVRACTPSPGAWTTLDGVRLKLGPLRPEPIEVADPPPAGELRLSKNHVLVGSGTGCVLLGEVQPPGKRPMPAIEWVRGARLQPNARLGT